MATPVKLDTANSAALPAYSSILVALDASDHANRGVEEACALATQGGATLTGVHAYAAQMHDRRFRQMEGGLPEQFRGERELERQRDVHDKLITRGLSIITDSYLDEADSICATHGLTVQRRSLEGKNYRALLNEANNGDYDLLVLGALGVGAIEGARLGTVCERTVRRVSIDTLIIREPDRALADGPILVAIDGSPRSFGGLLSALALARHWQVPVEVVAAYDPFFHYVAFKRIAGVLSDEAAEVFRFKEQEKLHEEIIDAGLAKIYEGHLSVAESVADEFGLQITTRLLEGKPYEAVARHAAEHKPSMLVLGKLGIHADDGLDIGGNAENLLRQVDCAVLLSQREYHPRVDQIAEVSISWTREAEQRMQGVPDFVRPMARMAILRYAQERGHSVITASIVDQASGELMPGRGLGTTTANAPHSNHADAADELAWTPEAQQQLAFCKDPSLRANLRLRAVKKARAAGASEIQGCHVAAFVNTPTSPTAAHWDSAALARLMRVPEGFMRDAVRSRIEQRANNQQLSGISLEFTERILETTRMAMTDPTAGDASAESTRPTANCPFAGHAESPVSTTLPWSTAAQSRLNEVPQGLCRNMTRKATQTRARELGLKTVDIATVEMVIGEAMRDGPATSTSMPWEGGAYTSLEHSPPAIRARLVHEAQVRAQEQGRAQVTTDDIKAIESAWCAAPDFHFIDCLAKPGTGIEWTAAAQTRITRVPEGFMRDLTRQRIEAYARREGETTITPELIEHKFSEWGEGSSQQQIRMSWSAAAQTRIEQIPPFVRGMIIREVERCAEHLQIAEVTSEVIDRAIQAWHSSGQFHSEAGTEIYD